MLEKPSDKSFLKHWSTAAKMKNPCFDPLKKDEAQAGLPPECADPGKRLQDEL